MKINLAQHITVYSEKKTGHKHHGFRAAVVGDANHCRAINEHKPY